jgi:hypothetical protein
VSWLAASIGRQPAGSAKRSSADGKDGTIDHVGIGTKRTPKATAQVAERLRAAIAAVIVPGTEHRLSISLGVATVAAGTGARRFVDVLTEADRAVYDAKLGGRDRVSLRLLARGHGPQAEDARPGRAQSGSSAGTATASTSAPLRSTVISSRVPIDSSNSNR